LLLSFYFIPVLLLFLALFLRKSTKLTLSISLSLFLFCLSIFLSFHKCKHLLFGVWASNIDCFACRVVGLGCHPIGQRHTEVIPRFRRGAGSTVRRRPGLRQLYRSGRLSAATSQRQSRQRRYNAHVRHGREPDASAWPRTRLEAREVLDAPVDTPLRSPGGHRSTVSPLLSRSDRTTSCRSAYTAQCLLWVYIYTVSQKKRHPFYICHNLVRCHPIYPILGRNILQEICNKHSCTAHHTSFHMLVLYLVKSSTDFYGIQ